MASSFIAICDSFDVPATELDGEAGRCAGILLNRIRRSMRVPGRGLIFEVLYQDRRIEGPDNEFSLEFHVIERDLKAIFDMGAPALIGACRTWIDRHGIDAAADVQRVLALDYFEQPRAAHAAA